MSGERDHPDGSSALSAAPAQAPVGDACMVAANDDRLTTVQQRVLAGGYLDASSVLQLPTGSGKTFLARHAIARVLERGRKAVYLSPIRALARELAASWSGAFGEHRVGIYTGEAGGDDLADPIPPAEASVLIATPEKLDLYLRSWGEHLRWLAEVDLLVIDELHTLGGGRRGATLEGAVMRLRALNPFVQCLGLSATLGNPQELAQWLGGRAFIDRARLVPQRWHVVTHKSSEDKLSLLTQGVCADVAAGGKSIVFVQARPRAESIAKHLAEAGIAVAAHHAGLSRAARRTAEEGFRTGAISVLVATPTLAVGVNLPARAAHIDDLQRWGGEAFEPLSTNEVWQLAGRAGRKGLDKVGDVTLYSPKWDQRAARRYLSGAFEPVSSALGSSEALRVEQLLAAYGSRVALTVAQAARLLDDYSFWAREGSPCRVDTLAEVARITESMAAAEMVTVGDEGAVRATTLGRLASRFMLAPATVLGWARAQDAGLVPSVADVLLLIVSSADFNARLRADQSEIVALEAQLACEPVRLAGLEPDVLRRVLPAAARDEAGAVKTALALRAWTRLGELDEAAQALGCEPHDLEEARREAVRMGQALAAVAEVRERRPRLAAAEGAPVADDEPTFSQRVSAVVAMVCAGLDDAAATLAQIDGIGPVLARRLRDDAGVADVEDLAVADPSELAARVRGLSAARAARWIDDAAGFVVRGGAHRFREIAGDGSAAARPGVARGLDPSRWARAKALAVRAIEPGARWLVEGGAEPHVVQSQPADDGGAGAATAIEAQRWSCDCADWTGRLCKHVVAVRAACGDPLIPPLGGEFPAADMRLDLASRWTRARVTRR